MTSLPSNTQTGIPTAHAWPARLLSRCGVATAVVCSLATGLAAPRSAQAQYGFGENRIMVTGVGEMRARPDTVELATRVSGDAELSDDAMVKFRGAKKAAEDAITALKLPNLTIESQGFSLAGGVDQREQQRRIHGGQPPTNVRLQVQYSGVLRIRLTEVDQMGQEDLMKTVGKLVDVAQDAGISIISGPAQSDNPYSSSMTRFQAAPFLMFIRQDLDELREQAYSKAMDDARQRAARLAKLSGRELGQVITANEVEVSGDTNPYGGYEYRYGAPTGATSKRQISTSTSDEIPIRVRLQVAFALVGSSGTARRAPSETKSP